MVFQRTSRPRLAAVHDAGSRRQKIIHVFEHPDDLTLANLSLRETVQPVLGINAPNERLIGVQSVEAIYALLQCCQRFLRERVAGWELLKVFHELTESPLDALTLRFDPRFATFVRAPKGCDFDAQSRLNVL